MTPLASTCSSGAPATAPKTIAVGNRTSTLVAPANYQPGETAVISDLPWGRIGLTICYDVRFPALYRALAEAGAEVYLASRQPDGTEDVAQQIRTAGGRAHALPCR